MCTFMNIHPYLIVIFVIRVKVQSCSLCFEKYLTIYEWFQMGYSYLASKALGSVQYLANNMSPTGQNCVLKFQQLFQKKKHFVILRVAAQPIKHIHIIKTSPDGLLENPQLLLDFSRMLQNTETMRRQQLRLKSLHLITLKLHSSAITPFALLQAGKYANSGD